MPLEDRLIVRLAFTAFEVYPKTATLHSSWLALPNGLVEIHEILVGQVLFTLCEVIENGRLILIDAAILPTVDEEEDDEASAPSSRMQEPLLIASGFST